MSSLHRTLARHTQALDSLRFTVASFLIVAAVLLPLRAAVADWYDVPTGSMRPTLIEGDRIAVDNRAFGLRVPLTHTWIARWGSPLRGDVVTLASPETGERLVKRVVAVAGDRIAMREGRLILNGRTVEYSVENENWIEPLPDGRKLPALHAIEHLPGATHPVTYLRATGPRRSFEEIVVPAEHLFVMGDNRDLSHDSRAFGPVPVESVTGRTKGIVFSLNRDAFFRPRGDRWLRGLPR